MSDSDFDRVRDVALQLAENTSEFEDVSIRCIDCNSEFIWTSGEQVFFRDKNLTNPPKRCKDCKHAKNRRLAAIATSRITGKRHRIEMSVDCARCSKRTTVPFYPCQDRPVYCRECYIEISSQIAKATSG